MSQVNSTKSNSNQKPIKPLFNEVDWDEGFPFSNEFNDIFCQKDVIEETNHVFLGIDSGVTWEPKESQY